MAEVGVVHLVRRRNGTAPLARFLASCRRRPAGMPYELVLIFKGFSSGRIPPDYEALLADVPHRGIFFPDRGLDLRPYFEAARTLEHRYLCFLNSFSYVLDDGWLAKLYRWVAADGVGIVGATGSWQSFATSSAERENALRKLGFAARLHSRIGHVFAERDPAVVIQRAGAWLLGAAGVWKPARYFPEFPNYHVRTNAFMAARATLVQVRLGPVFSKLSAYFFESGRNGLTPQIMRLGLRPLLVGRDGAGYEKEQWHLANTFWQGDQQNLLVADNRTDLYSAGSPAERAELSRLAWGPRAHPA